MPSRSRSREEGDQVLARYAYDPFGRRVKKEVGGRTTWFLHADEGLIAEFDGAGEVIRQYGYAPDATWNSNPLTLRSGGETFYYLNDALGAPKKLVTKSGAVVWSAVQEAFGAAHVDPASRIENPLRGSGQYFDAESGLHYNTHRYYDPRLGRYIQADPLGELADPSLNLYRFCANDPVNSIDPLGLCPESYNNSSPPVGILQVLFPAHTAPASRYPIGGSTQSQLAYANSVNTIRSATMAAGAT